MLTKNEKMELKRQFIFDALRSLSRDPSAKSCYKGVKPGTFTAKDIAKVAKDLAKKAGHDDTYSGVSVSATLRLANNKGTMKSLVISRNEAVVMSGNVRSFAYSYSITL